MDPKYLSKTVFKLQSKLYNIEKKIMDFEEDIHNDWSSYHEPMLHSDLTPQYFSEYDFFTDQISSNSYAKLMLKKEFIESQIDFFRDFYKIG